MCMINLMDLDVQYISTLKIPTIMGFEKKKTNHIIEKRCSKNMLGFEDYYFFKGKKKLLLI